MPTANIALSYDFATNTATFTFPGYTDGVLPNGRYTATLAAAGLSNAIGQTLASDATVNFLFLAGDANNDGTVNLIDFNTLAANFNQSDRTFSQGDFNYDGVVNLLDFNILAGNFNQAISLPASRPPEMFALRGGGGALAEPDGAANNQCDRADIRLKADRSRHPRRFARARRRTFRRRVVRNRAARSSLRNCRRPSSAKQDGPLVKRTVLRDALKPAHHRGALRSFDLRRQSSWC